MKHVCQLKLIYPRIDACANYGRRERLESKFYVIRSQEETLKFIESSGAESTFTRRTNRALLLLERQRVGRFARGEMRRSSRVRASPLCVLVAYMTRFDVRRRLVRGTHSSAPSTAARRAGCWLNRCRCSTAASTGDPQQCSVCGCPQSAGCWLNRCSFLPTFIFSSLLLAPLPQDGSLERLLAYAASLLRSPSESTQRNAMLVRREEERR